MVKGFDLHCHIFPEPFINSARSHRSEQFQARVVQRNGQEYLQCPGDFFYPLTPELYDIDSLIQSMNQRGLQWAALSLAPPALGYWADTKVISEHVAMANEFIAAACKTYPDRLVGLGTLPVQLPNEVPTIMHHAVTNLGLKGFEIGTNVDGRTIGDPWWDPVFETAQALDCPIFVHPYLPAGDDRMQDYYLHNLVGMVSETGLAIAHFILSGASDRFPRVKLVFAHGGGTALWIQGRWNHGAHCRPEAQNRTVLEPSEYLKRYYYDSIFHSPIIQSHAIELVGASRFVLGTDYPFDMGPDRPLEELGSVPGLNDEDRLSIANGTARALFNLGE